VGGSTGFGAARRFREAVDRLGPAPEPHAVLDLWAEDPSWRHPHPEYVHVIAGGGPLDGSCEGGRRGAADRRELAVGRPALRAGALRRDRLGAGARVRASTATGVGSGVPVERRTAHECRFDAGRLVRFKVYSEREDALRAADRYRATYEDVRRDR
jgi:hypothetical protein